VEFVLKFLGGVENLVKNTAQIHVISWSLHKRLLAGTLRVSGFLK
jgi:hypothetical protein